MPSRLRSHARRGRTNRNSKGRTNETYPSLPRSVLGAALSAGVLLALSPNPAFSDENCHRLEALAHQYAGVQLTSDQKQIKQQMVAWYSTNCVRQARR